MGMQKSTKFINAQYIPRQNSTIVATRVFRKFEDVILCKHKKHHFFAVVSIADIGGRIVRMLVSNNIHLAAVRVDNTRFNTKALIVVQILHK